MPNEVMTMNRSKFQLTIGFALAFAITISLAVRAEAQTYADLANFNGTDGSFPGGSVTQATDGNFYGVTYYGGANKKGSLFQVTPGGTITSIYSFCSQSNCADGEGPVSTPVLGSDGNLYGATWGGGGTAEGGIVYKMTLGGEITILHTFCTTSACLDGDAPAAVMLASDGNFYGTTFFGGEFKGGTLFKITPTGVLTVLHSFCSEANCADGNSSDSAPIQASDGNFYGATQGGGVDGVGVLYEMTATGGYKVIQNFCYGALYGCPMGSTPNPLVQDADGNLFGTTKFGGSYNSGTVFEITSAGQDIVLHKFEYGGSIDPSGALIIANDGNLYGAAANNSFDDGNGYSSVFEITEAGVFTALASNYDSLNGPVLQATDGNFYGTTAFGGADNYGTVFKLSTGLSPLVEAVPVAGPVGKIVIILGTGLTGSTSVTFNGVAAAFTVESDTYIKATVPKGATSGAVSVVTPSGTLKSNPQFVVSK